MKMDYLQSFLPDLGEFREKTMQFHRKEMSVPEYKGFSGGFGSYAQRGGEKHMLRLRVAGGRITKERLAFIVEACDKYDINLAKLTTCQSLQLHNLEAQELCSLIEEAWRAGMITRGGGGDFPRNVMASPLSGVQADEYFDVLPYAEAMGEYLMQFIKSVRFPRKLKVGFSNGPKNETHVTYRDLGFAANPDGTFDVYAAGGLGNNPALGVLVAEHIDPKTVCCYAEAMIETFVENGNYENRGRSRTRYLQDTMGADGFKAAFLEHLKNSLAKAELYIEVRTEEVKKAPAGEKVTHRRALPQKQEGLYSVFYQPIGGVIAPQKLKAIYEAIKDMPEVELRITPEEAIYIINCTADEARALIAVTEDGANTLFETSVACIGNGICQVGLRDSQEVLRSCVEAVRKENFADGVLPQIHISGCPSSCGTHQTAGIGFRGAVRQTPDGPKQACAIFVGGDSHQGSEKIAEAGKSILVEDMPRFLIELGRMISEAGSTYAVWSKENPDALMELIERY